jgi:soluble lytic murein transglycosylase
VASWNWPKSLGSLVVAGLFALALPLEAIGQTTPVASKPADKPAAKKTDKPAKAEKKTDKPKADKKSADKKSAAKTSAAKPKADKKAKKEPPNKEPAKPAAAASSTPLPAARPGAATASAAAIPAAPEVPAVPPTPSFPSTVSTSAVNVALTKRALDHLRARRRTEANETKNAITDPVAKKLVEWAILRNDDGGADFSRYMAFINANPNWPSITTLRRKAEAILFQDRHDAATIRAYFGSNKPLSAKGRLALARALMAQGDRKGAEALVREVWRTNSISQDVELKVQEQFGEFLTRADHKARMDRRLYEKDDTEAGLRAATRLGGHEPAIAKARIAMLGKGGDNKLVEAVPASAHNDIGYKLAKIQMLRRADKAVEAAALMATIPQLDDSHDLDEWWIERRLLVRKLLDENDPKRAYIVARDATPPTRDNYRAEHQFTAGWVALRYLNDPTTAAVHFKKVTEAAENPIALARGLYWQGRAAEALKKPQEARQHYQAAARFPTAYYGQIARAKAGLGEITLNSPPALSAAERSALAKSEVVRAAELLYAADARDLLNAAMADLGDKSDDIPTLVMLGELAHKYQDPRGMLLVGKLALARGHPLDHAAFPTVGLPRYTAIGPEVEPALVYSIARQESWFNPKTVSSANAMGFMQVTPAAGKYLAKKFNVTYDQKRLLSDNVYNLQMGAAELGDLIKDYRGSYIMSFAAYNAGRGRVRDWVARYGDPRDPKVDPIDWVERIPFSETRNYVQRVMENAQVYRVQFGGGSKLLIEADLRRGAMN